MEKFCNLAFLEQQLEEHNRNEQDKVEVRMHSNHFNVCMAGCYSKIQVWAWGQLNLLKSLGAARHISNPMSNSLLYEPPVPLYSAAYVMQYINDRIVFSHTIIPVFCSGTSIHILSGDLKLT